MLRRGGRAAHRESAQSLARPALRAVGAAPSRSSSPTSPRGCATSTSPSPPWSSPRSSTHHLHLDGGHGGRERPDLRRPSWRSPASSPSRSPPTTLHWFVLAVVTVSYLVLRRITRSPFGMVLQAIRENEPAPAPWLPCGALQDRRRHALGPLRGPGRRPLCAAERVRRPDFVFLVVSPDHHLQCHGWHRHPRGPRRGAAFFLLLREGLSASSPSTTSSRWVSSSRPWSLHAPGPLRLPQRRLNQ